MKLILALFGTFLAQECEVNTCEELENALTEAEEKLDKLSEENKIAIEKQKLMKDKLRQLNTKVFPAGRLFASCQEIHDQNERRAGYYQIQPSLEYDPFWVTCEFDDEFGYTYLAPNMTNPYGVTAPPLADGGCDPRGCYKDQIHYNSTTIDQIEALMEVSSYCEQRITHNCSVNAISRYAYWTDRRGLYELEYWDGSHDENASGCECSLNGENVCSDLHNPSNKCNCDDLNTDAYDEGLLTNMEHLPVTVLNYGDSGKRYAWIEYHLGPFICRGKDYLYPSDVLYSDFHFKAAFNDIYDYPAIRASGNHTLALTNIIYDQTYGAINTDNNGFVFTSPTDGIYMFELNLSLFSVTYVNYRISFMVNNEPVGWVSSTQSVPYDGLEIKVHSNYGKVEVPLYREDVLTFWVENDTLIPEHYDASAYGHIGLCYTGDQSHRCTFVSGKILERIPPKN